MTQTFSTDDKNDLFIGLDGRLSVSKEINAVMAACETAAQAQLGEMIFAIDRGVPNFQTIWQSSRNIAQFEAYFRRSILSVDGVKSIKEFSSSVDGGVISYTAVIETIYGEGQING